MVKKAARSLQQTIKICIKGAWHVLYMNAIYANLFGILNLGWYLAQ